MRKPKIQVYDNGGETIDRYTVIIGKHIYFMSHNPTSPQGVNMYEGERAHPFETWPGMGELLDHIPEEIQRAVEERART